MSAHRFAVPYPRLGSVLLEEELEILAEVIKSRKSLSQGCWREAFERKFGQLVGSRHALSVTSGTVALTFAIHLLDLELNDEVIVTPQTYKATIQPLLDYQVRVRFCDIEPNSMNLDAQLVEALITNRTKAIILVHYGGLPADMDKIMKVARRHGLVVIEDCAHTLGAEYRGNCPGALADIGCFSFHSTKNITTLGEGGMLTCNRDDWAERIDRIRSNDADAIYVRESREIGGRDAPPRWVPHAGEAYTHRCSQVRYSGSNATLSEPSAAVGVVQLNRLPQLVERRQTIAARITEVLEGFPSVCLPEVPPHVRHAYHLYTFFVRPAQGGERDALVAELERQGVEMQLRYFPLHLLPEWQSQGHRLGECPVAEQLWFTEQVNLPCSPALSDNQVDHLVDVLEQALGKLSCRKLSLAKR